MKNKTSVAFDEEREKLFVRKFIQPAYAMNPKVWTK